MPPSAEGSRAASPPTLLSVVPAATRQHQERDARHQGVGEEVGCEDLALVTPEAGGGHPAVRNHADRAERRKVAGVRAVRHHQRRQEWSDAGAEPDGHREGCDERDAGNRPWADRGEETGDTEEDDGQQTHAAAGKADEPVGEAGDCAVLLGQAEEQRDAGQRDEQRTGEAGEDLIGRMPRVEPKRPGEGDCDQPDVDLRRAAEDDGEEERDQGGRGRAQGRLLLRHRLTGCRGRRQLHQAVAEVQCERRRLELDQILELLAEILQRHARAWRRTSRARADPRSRLDEGGSCSGVRWRSGSS